MGVKLDWHDPARGILCMFFSKTVIISLLLSILAPNAQLDVSSVTDILLSS